MFIVEFVFNFQLIVDFVKKRKKKQSGFRSKKYIFHIVNSEFRKRQ